MNMTIATREAGDVTIVDLRGRLVVGAEGAALRRQVRDLLHDGKNKLLLNASQVEFIDSSGLGELVTALRSVRKQGGELKLLNLGEKFHDLLRITKLYSLFEITDDEASAVRSFTQFDSGRQILVELTGATSAAPRCELEISKVDGQQVDATERE